MDIDFELVRRICQDFVVWYGLAKGVVAAIEWLLKKTPAVVSS